MYAPHERSFSIACLQESLELHFLQRVLLRHIQTLVLRLTFLRSTLMNSIDDAISATRLLDARYGPVDYTCELGPVIFLATLPQAQFRILNRKPGTISLGLFGRTEP